MQHHGEGLLAESGDREWVETLKRDWRSAELDEADRAMLAYVDKVTRAPATTVEADVVALREAGFSDRQILDVNQIAGFFAWCNRTVDGLGVELEGYWSRGGPSSAKS